MASALEALVSEISFRGAGAGAYGRPQMGGEPGGIDQDEFGLLLIQNTPEVYKQLRRLLDPLRAKT